MVHTAVRLQTRWGNHMRITCCLYTVREKNHRSSRLLYTWSRRAALWKLWRKLTFCLTPGLQVAPARPRYAGLGQGLENPSCRCRAEPGRGALLGGSPGRSHSQSRGTGTAVAVPARAVLLGLMPLPFARAFPRVCSRGPGGWLPVFH